MLFAHFGAGPVIFFWFFIFFVFSKNIKNRCERFSSNVISDHLAKFRIQNSTHNPDGRTDGRTDGYRTPQLSHPLDTTFSSLSHVYTINISNLKRFFTQDRNDRFAHCTNPEILKSGPQNHWQNFENGFSKPSTNFENKLWRPLPISKTGF